MALTIADNTLAISGMKEDPHLLTLSGRNPCKCGCLTRCSEQKSACMFWLFNPEHTSLVMIPKLKLGSYYLLAVMIKAFG